MSEFVQVTLHISQVELLHGSVHVAAQDKKLPTPLANQLYDLEDFMGDVLQRPRAYPVTGQMARSLKVRARRMKHPPMRPDGTVKGEIKVKGRRKARAVRRREAHRERRRARVATAHRFNAERAEREIQDHRESKPGVVSRLLGRGAGGS